MTRRKRKHSIYVPASPVTITRPDGSTETLAAYSPSELNLVRTDRRKARQILAAKRERAHRKSAPS